MSPPLDHGILNIPGRTNGINAELDRYKSRQAKSAKVEARLVAKARKADKQTARELFAQRGESLILAHSAKLGEKALRAHIAQLLKWEPRKFIALARRHETDLAADCSK